LLSALVADLLDAEDDDDDDENPRAEKLPPTLEELFLALFLPPQKKNGDVVTIRREEKFFFFFFFDDEEEGEDVVARGLMFVANARSTKGARTLANILIHSFAVFDSLFRAQSLRTSPRTIFKREYSFCFVFKGADAGVMHTSDQK